jgi:hypothetical protein
MTQPDLNVICYSGSTYAEEPREFVWGGRQFTVDRVVARGRTPAGPSFSVACGPQQFRLFYDEAADRWTIEPPADSDETRYDEG